MIKKIFKFLWVSLTIFVIVFSNIPFYAVSSTFNTYVKSYNIVDKAWHLQKDSNVVDKFASFRNLTEELKIKETYAATSGQVYPTLGVTIAESPWLDNNWTNPTNVYADDAATAYVIAASFDSADQTFVLKATGFDFSAIPDGSTINGVTARVNAWYRSGQGAGAMDLCQLLDINKAKVGTNQCATQVALTTTNTTIITKGSTVDKWGNALDTAWIKDPDFGIAIGIKATAANSDVDVDYVTLEIDYTPPADSTPPTPNPMTFATAPANDSTTQISMTATTATDATTPPVSYFFTLDNTNCGANAGTGGTSSAWQAGTGYSDSGLTANKCYGYTVKARDSVGVPNETGVSGISSAYTSANTPGTPALGSPTTSTLNLTNAENSNPTANPTTGYAVQVVTTSDGTWFNKWVDASGNPSATAVWLTDAQLDALVLQGLQASTLYGVKVKAKNQDNDETPLSAEGQGTTSAPANTLTISASVGSKVANIDSGATSQFVHNTSCTTDGTCSAFKLVAGGGDVVVTSITVTESSASLNADAELSNATLIYDTDANYSNGTTGTFGTDATFTSQAVTFTNIGLNIPNGSTYYFYIRTDFVNGVNNPTGGATVNFQIANTTDVVSDGTESGTATLAGTTTIRPNVTDVTSSPLVDGGRNGETFTITGAGFGAVCGSLSVVVGGLTLTCNSAATTTISATIPSTQITTYGGASSMLVTVGGTADDASQTYYVYPNVTVPPTNDSGREASDVTVQGTRFGATQGTVQFTKAFDNPSPINAAITSWSDTSITVTVPTLITDTTYLGEINVIRNSDSKPDLVYNDVNGFRVLPRITSLVPSNGIVGASVTVNGDHLCQSGTCPVSFSAANKVTFNSGVVATAWGTWSDTVIETAVPTGAITGDVVVTSNTTYTSNALTFTVNANTTTLATGSDPAVNTIAPGASATDVNLFTLQTNGGTESVTSVTVNLSTNSGIGLLAITDNANTVLGSTASPVTGSNVISVAGMSAGTGVTTFKVRVTPFSHATMPAPAGASYAITAPVTAWAGSNTHAGSDTNTNALTIDNTSPANVTVSTATAGDAQVSLAWTNPADSDFHSTVVLRRANSAVADIPAEGTTYIVGNTIGTATVACVVATPTANCIDSGLANGTPYHYKIFAKDSSVNYSATGVVPTGSPATPTLTQTLTVGTVGTQAVNLNSGSTAQHIGGAGTTAFTLQINTGSSNVTSVKVSETGTVAMANLANPKLYYENAVNSASCAYGGAESFVSGSAPVGETVTFTLPSVAVGLTANVTCLYFVSDVTSSTVGGQTIELQITNPSTDVAVSSGVNDDTVAKTLAGTTTIRPNVTSISYPQSPDGGRNGDTFVIYGAGFGTSCANATTTIGSLNLTCVSVNNTIATTTIPSTQTTTYGGTGASGLLVTVGGTADDASQTYYVYPNVTVPPTNDSGREGSDVTVQGTRFGATQGTVQFTKAFDNPSPINAAITSWSDTSITVTVPTLITDTTYLGEINVIRNSDSKPDLVYNDVNGFRILPRITANTANSGIIADRIMITGDHLCQGAGCPISPNRSGANDNVKFGSTQALDGDFVNSGAAPCSGNAQAWTDTEICVKVPAGTPVGAQATIVRSNAYNSGTMAFTVSSVTPTDPTSLIQKDNNLVTITTGATSSSTPIRYTFDTSSGVSGGTMYAQVEVRPVLGVNKDFTSTCSANPYCFEGLGTAYGGGTINLLATSTPVDDIYHWQARVCYNKNGTHTTACDGTGDNPSALWVSYGGNLETVTDFKIDTTAPVISSPSSSGPPTPGTNTATIKWTTDEQSTSQVQYQAVAQASCTAFSFASSCSTNNDCTIINTTPEYSPHTTELSNLNSGTYYCYRVRSKDAVGNEKIDTNNYWFTTQPVSTPAKTTSFYIVSTSTIVTSVSPLSQTFSVVMPENATSTKSIFVEIKGIYDITATSPAPSFTVQVNSETSKTYSLPAVVSKSYFKILHQINAINIYPASNTLTITPVGTNTNIHVSSADINVTYGYTP